MLVNNIKVIDDFLPRTTYNDVLGMISREPLLYGARSNFVTDPHGHWHRDFVTAGPHNLADVSFRIEADSTLEPIEAVWNCVRSSLLPETLLIRCYVNGYTYGTDGYFHTDSGRPDEYTTVLYMTDVWLPNWAGETVFLDDDEEVSGCVLPKPNRAVLFPARVPHATASSISTVHGTSEDTYPKGKKEAEC